MYHFKSDWSQKKLKKHFKNRSQAQRRYALNRNFFLSAEDAHAFDPTYVVRESIYRFTNVKYLISLTCLKTQEILMLNSEHWKVLKIMVSIKHMIWRWVV